MCSLVCLNAKNEQKLKKYYFSFDQIKNKFAHFGGLKLKIYLNFLIGDCSWRKRKAFSNWKKYSFLMFLWFFESENFAARGKYSPIFFSWTH